MRKNWYREIHGKTRNRLTYKLPPTDDAMRRGVQTSQSISLMRILLAAGRKWNARFGNRIIGGELSNRSGGEGWASASESDGRGIHRIESPRRYSCNDSSKLVLHPRSRGEASDGGVADDERRDREGKCRRTETEYVDWLQAEALTNSCHLD